MSKMILVDEKTVKQALEALDLAYSLLVGEYNASAKTCLRAREEVGRALEQQPADELDRNACERIKISRQDWCNEEHACQLLGVPLSVLELMSTAKTIDADPAWKSDLLKGGKYSVRSIQALIAKLMAVPRQNKTDDTIELRAINSRRIGERKSLVRLMAAIGSGELQPVMGPAHSVGLLRFDRDDVARHLGSVAVRSPKPILPIDHGFKAGPEEQSSFFINILAGTEPFS